jgi:hypothetical protein
VHETWSAVGRCAGQGLGLLPASVGELVLVLRGRPAQGLVVARRHALGDEPTASPEGVGAGRVGVHAVLGVLLGIVFWWLVWMGLLATARGPFYGFVEPGPYDDSWGGPSLAGAWVVHAGVWALVVAALALLWWGIVGLHARLTEHLLGGPRRVWVVPVALVVALVAVLLVVAWVRQI